MDPDSLLEVRDLHTHFRTDDGDLGAVNGVSFTLKRGRILALVGESGCGKSVTAFSLLQLVRKPGFIQNGQILFRNRDNSITDIASLKEGQDALYDVRGPGMGMVFQEPMTALSPVHTIGNQIMEALFLHQDITPQDAEKRAIEMLRLVGIPAPEKRLKQYPFEFSGGMRQRVVIAMALIGNPRIIIADEPTTALDVTIQAQILSLLTKAREKKETGILLITHDLGVVAQTADDVAVMYLGKIVERGSVKEVLQNPRHPYTQGLLRSLPGLSASGSRLSTIKGSVPSLYNIPSGCPFHPRCEHFKPGLCDVGGPPEPEVTAEGRKIACVRHADIPKVSPKSIDHDRAVAAAQAQEEKAATTTASKSPEEKTSDTSPLLTLRGVCKYFPIGKKAWWQRAPQAYLKAVEQVDLDIFRGETIGLVGESGSGKTTLSRTLLGAFAPTAGKMTFREEVDGPETNLHELSHKDWKPYRQKLQMIFQDPFSSLNPRMTVEEIVGEPLLIHGLAKRGTMRAKVKEMLARVGLNPEFGNRYPHAFSGGQRQRIGIARALILEPKFIVADEAVSALDVSVQAQIINLLKDLQEQMDLTTLFVAHDLSVVRHLCDRVAVMYAGRIIEVGPVDELFNNPRHPYTQMLLSAVPDPDPDVPMNFAVQGEPADPSQLPGGCSFHPRCPECFAKCKTERPDLIGSRQRASACWLEEKEK
ncbi:MAG: ABC transporter ATP-binding protein [Opitutales bacterium]|nr:ABC transporter ATP-binding protein [Opitutales bacterium]